jgi:hypothetical protein
MGFLEADGAKTERGPMPVLGLISRPHPDIQESDGIALSDDHLLASASPVLELGAQYLAPERAGDLQCGIGVHPDVHRDQPKISS